MTDVAGTFSGINWLAVIVAAASPFALGAVWYGPIFGRVWMGASGMTEERMRQGNVARTFGVAFVLELIAAGVLAMFIPPGASMTFGLFAGLATGLFWVATALGVVYLFEQRPLAHWAVNASYMIVAFAVMGAILGAWH